MKNKLWLFIKKRWMMIIGGVILFSFVYSHLTSYFVSKEVNKILNANPFLHYSLEEYETYFEDKGNDVGDEYSEESIDLEASLDNQKIEIHLFDESNGGRSFRLYKTDDDIITLPFGVEWGDSYRDIKHKMSLNILNTRFSSFMRMGTLIDCKDIKEYTGITVMARDSDDYALTFWFDEHKKLNEVIITDYHLN